MKYFIFTIPLFSLCISYFLCKFIIYFSHKKGILDQPNEFRQHDTPTPYFGGSAIFIAIILGFGAFAFIAKSDYIIKHLLFFSLFFIVGLLDDIYKLTSIPKLIFIIIASFISSLIFNRNLFDFSLTFLALVFFTNSFNLLDNVDGLCASTAIAILLAILIYLTNSCHIDLLLLISLTAIAGFLILNFPKAKIFMGDSGSLLIGAICVIFILRYSESKFQLLNFIPLFWLPLYDTFSVVIVRAAAGKSILIGGKDHFSHRLMRHGLSNSAVVIILSFITFAAGLLSLYLSPLISAAVFIFLIAAAASFELLTSHK